MNRLRWTCMFCFTILSFCVRGADENLLSNPDFRAADTGAPAGWTVGKGQKVTIDPAQPPAGTTQSLRVDVIADGGSSYGQVYQTVKAKPNTLYRLEGRTKSTQPGMAFLSVKLIKAGRELKRIGSAKSQAEWSAISLDFPCDDADEIQILCRWEQNAQRGWVGKTCWFAGLRLVEKGAAPPPPPWKVAIGQAAAIEPVAAITLPVKSATGDLYITPGGAGKRDGTSWEHALPGNAAGAIQSAWDALAPGQSCRVGSGVYVNVALTISSGGAAPDKLKRLVGEDTGRGLPWFVGNWRPDVPDKGDTFIALANGVDHCAFENLQLARYNLGMSSRKGGHVGLLIRNFDVYESRFGIYLQGFALADEPDAASHDITIQDCDFIHFTKSGVRLQAGNYDVRIINCVADAGGIEWMKEAFQICFNVAGDLPRRLSNKDAAPWASEHDILFINCTARNAIYSKARYWQGDGFLAEGGVRNVAFINCASHDNADGGWDVKATNVVYVNCMGLRNKMNFRVWHDGFFYNSLSAYASKHGGSWTSAGLWTLGDTRADHSTFHNNDARNLCADSKKLDDDAAGATRTGRITLDHCLISIDGVNSQTEHLYAGESMVTKVESAEWFPKTDKTSAIGADPQYIAAANKDWTGAPPDAFDSKQHGVARGFHSTISAAWRAKPVPQLIESARALLKHKGWDDFRQQADKLTRP